MSHSSSSQPPHNPDPPRRLLSPEERFGPPPNDEPKPDPLVLETTETTTRRDDEMARRHLSPRARRHLERTSQKRAKIEAARRQGRETQRHEQRAEIEREFALSARAEPPKPSPRPKRRLSAILKRIFALVCLLFCVQLAIAAFTAPQFQIQNVSLSGYDVTSPDELRPLAAKLNGQNFLRADRKAVEKAVEKLPTVAAARVVRLPLWPPQVELRVTERVPVLKVGAGNDWWVADESGVPFRRPNAEDGALYAVVAPQLAPQLGQKLDAKIWADAVALNKAVLGDNALVQSAGSDPDLPFWQLRRIYFDKHGQASLRLVGKGALRAHNELLLRLGDERWGKKLARARVALSYFERTGRRAQELDLLSLERPVWRPIPTQIAVEPKPEDLPLNSG
ncbi:MAG: FtsQ-type POTRA domain-containing protein [Armatimonadetes bacterium]|nr:FtsQ-type POTRA domain-containing protein [Armatimonadota bacterium]